jgi:predicted peptidase
MNTSTYPYLIYHPEAYAQEKQKKWPIILFLHGAGERGEDFRKVQAQGLPRKLQQDNNFPFVVAYPQCPLPSYWQVELLNSWLDEVLEKVGDRVDTSRMYLTGLSMGGYGTWRWATAFPHRFAAIAPICGGGDPAEAHRLKHIPAWAFHGAKDDIVPLSASVEMVEALKAAGGDVQFTIYPEARHDSWTQTYDNRELYEWFLKHRKKSE